MTITQIEKVLYTAKARTPVAGNQGGWGQAAPFDTSLSQDAA